MTAVSNKKVNDKKGSLLVVRVRGTINTPTPVRTTLLQLRLFKRHTATIIPDTPIYRGMLQTAKDWISWSSIDPATVEKILISRGQKIGGKKINSEDFKPWGFKSIKDMSKSISTGETALKNIEGLKPFFRLSPPKGGYKVSTRRSSGQGGILGQYSNLLTLTERMLEN